LSMGGLGHAGFEGVGEVAELGFAADVPEQQSEAIRIGGRGGDERVDGALGEAAGALADGGGKSVADAAENVAVQVPTEGRFRRRQRLGPDTAQGSRAAVAE
jgi:hypothetical protein